MVSFHINYPALVTAILAASFSGLITAIIAGRRDQKKEKVRQEERQQDNLKLEIKDLRISLYKLEKELTEWKEKYYVALQELIEVKGELEKTLVQIAHIEQHEELDPEFKK
jgi:septal ring factor EnvC (AmiA/AmiB activator)